MAILRTQTQGRGDIAAGSWLSSRYLHTSLLSSALPFLRVGDKSPLCCSTLASNDNHLFTFFLGLGSVSSLFCYFIATLSAPHVCFPWCSGWP